MFKQKRYIYNLNMRQICVFLISIFLINFNLNQRAIALSSAEFSGYAKALENCVLYKTEDLYFSEDNVLFVVPESYFVYILEDVSDEVLKVEYDRFVGYINSNYVIRSTFVPVVKTLQGVTCDIKNSAGTQIWNIPSTSGDSLTTISAGTLGIKYIASCIGKVPSGGKSNVWYYVSYVPDHNSTNVYEGYVYSENVVNLSEIVLNSESNPESIIDAVDPKEKVIYISPSLKTILVSIIVIPIIVLFLIILYKLMKKFKKNTKYDNFEEKNNNEKTMENQPVKTVSKLKEQLFKLKNLSLINKSKSQNLNYPNFPRYDGDDDLL